MRTPVIVVGAGAGGLVAALYLQRAGHDVALFEAQAHVGGCASAFSAKGFRFLAGATTLMGLEPEFPLGRVLRELDVPFTAPTAARNLTAWQAGEALTLLPDARANEVVLTERYGASFGRFWTRAATLGARGWEAVSELRFPPRGPGDLLATAGSRRAWGLVPALLRSTATAMGAQPARAKELLDELLLVSTQAKADAVPYLFGALGIEYLQRPLYLATGGLAALPERLAEVFVQRGGVLRTGTPVTAWTKVGAGFRVETPAGAFACAKLVLDLTHWDAERLAGPETRGTFASTVRRHPDAWAACTLSLGVEDVFGPDAAPYHQVLLDEPMRETGARSVFVTLSRPDDATMAPAGFRSVTMSCHVPARAWEGAPDERKARVAEAFLEALAQAFPRVRTAQKPVVLPGTPKTWQSFTGRLGGRVGGLPFDFTTLRRGYPSGRSGLSGLARVGDTVFPGQSVAACAWGARRVVEELLSR